MAEGNLEVNLYNGTRWVDIETATNNVLQHYVLSTSVDAEPINAITLADAATPLPLTWGLITALRDGSVINIGWTTFAESNVSHFDVERSTDGLRWSKAVSNIPAENMVQEHHYKAVDRQYITAGIFYRIRQTDLDGRSTYSKIVAVAPLAAATTLTLYPNPVTDKFQIVNPRSLAIRQVNVFNNAGLAVRQWDAQPQFYTLDGLPNGIYHLTILLENGMSQHFKLIKQ